MSMMLRKALLVSRFGVSDSGAVKNQGVRGCGPPRPRDGFCRRSASSRVRLMEGGEEVRQVENIPKEKVNFVLGKIS